MSFFRRKPQLPFGLRLPAARAPKVAEREGAESAAASDGEIEKSEKKKLSSAVLLVEDEFDNVRWGHRAYDGVLNLLAPINPNDSGEFWIEPGELKALMEVINLEMGRRIEKLRSSIQGVCKLVL